MGMCWFLNVCGYGFFIVFINRISLLLICLVNLCCGKFRYLELDIVEFVMGIVMDVVIS